MWLHRYPTVTGSASNKKITSIFAGNSPGQTTGCGDLKILDDKWSQRFKTLSDEFYWYQFCSDCQWGPLLALSTPITPYLGMGAGAGPD